MDKYFSMDELFDDKAEGTPALGSARWYGALKQIIPMTQELTDAGGSPAAVMVPFSIITASILVDILHQLEHLNGLVGEEGHHGPT